MSLCERHQSHQSRLWYPGGRSLWTLDGPKLPHSICLPCPHPTFVSALAGSHLTRQPVPHSTSEEMPHTVHTVPLRLSSIAATGSVLLCGVSWHMQGRGSILGTLPTAHWVRPSLGQPLISPLPPRPRGSWRLYGSNPLLHGPSRWEAGLFSTT